MSKYITNLVEDPEESPYGLISVYNMVYRVYGKETADTLNSDPEIKEKYHKKIYSLNMQTTANIKSNIPFEYFKIELFPP